MVIIIKPTVPVKGRTAIFTLICI